jgi:hypothetical protein
MNGGAWMPYQKLTYTLAKAPKIGAATADSTPSFSWGAATGETGWALDIADDAICSNVIDPQTPGAGVHSYTPVAVLPSGFGTYSWELTLTDGIGSHPMPCQTFDYTLMKKPPSGALLTTTKPAFSWASMVGASSWGLQVDDDPGFGLPIIDQTFGSSLPVATLSFKPLAPLAPGKYYWQLSPDGGTTWLPYWSFTIQ